VAQDVLVGTDVVARLAGESATAAERLRAALQYSYGAVRPSAVGRLPSAPTVYDTSLKLVRALESILKELAKAHDDEATKVFTAVAEYERLNAEGAWSLQSVFRYFGL
jgi:hypothetical protein